MSSSPLTYHDLDEIAVGQLGGVGPKRAEALSAFEITSVLDLLQHYPRRYIDRTREATLEDLAIGEEGVVLVRVSSVSSRRTRQRRSLVTARATDGTGSVDLTFFNQPWRAKQLAEGTHAVVFGKLDSYRGKLQMTNPVVDVVGGDKTGRIVAVYPQSEKAGLASWDIANHVAEALRRSAKRGFAEPLPESLLDRHDFVTRQAALTGIHRPESMREATEARRRLVFDELLRIQLALVTRKRALERTAQGFAHSASGELVRRFHAGLPYALTDAQRRAIGEIAGDMAKPAPMHRLLQGDVGSGKTLVAVSALLVAVEGGHQGALMAPTEVLAEQHFLGVRELVADLVVPDPATLMGERPLRVELLTNRTPAGERRRLAADLRSGAVDVLIGTHALIQEGVEFGSLGAIVVDEQHRFGVEQRAALRDKGAGAAIPDVLVMTATPIPRTAAMTVYGDLDVSVLDELPPGRTPIVTEWARAGDDEDAVWAHVRGEVDAGHQAYVVCPLIEDSPKLQVRSAEETYDRLVGGELAGLRVGLLHGRVTPGEKEKTMALFRDGALDVLVATTVIEVGVDVPNATVMVILDADRFGIAQLHQLRGRVGRGEASSRCYLVSDGATPEAETRLTALVDTTDGFELAEVDLELRGEGTIMGERQKGRTDLKLASLRRDREWVERARAAAFELADDVPLALAAEIQLLLGDEEAEFLFKS